MTALAGRFEGWLCISAAAVLPAAFYLTSRRDGIDGVAAVVVFVAFLLGAAICFSTGEARRLAVSIAWLAAVLLAAWIASIVFIGSNVGIY
jgi:UDP-N-acetylmuramyl pentapeptide phosphotransferase/UDP-N-acetylglucosamine-1-phosphate transferase